MYVGRAAAGSYNQACSGCESVTFGLVYDSIICQHSGIANESLNIDWSRFFPLLVLQQMYAVSCAFTLSCQVFILCVSYLQVICNRRNKTEEVKQKIIDYLEGKHLHLVALSAPFSSSLVLI